MVGEFIIAVMHFCSVGEVGELIERSTKVP